MSEFLLSSRQKFYVAAFADETPTGQPSSIDLIDPQKPAGGEREPGDAPINPMQQDEPPISLPIARMFAPMQSGGGDAQMFSNGGIQQPQFQQAQMLSPLPPSQQQRAFDALMPRYRQSQQLQQPQPPQQSPMRFFG